MTAVLLGKRVETKAPTVADRQFAAWHAGSNLLLEMAWMSEESAAAIQRGRRLADRMDRMADQFPVGTPERGEAEAVHWSLMAEAKRGRDGVRRKAKRFLETWEEMHAEHRDMIREMVSTANWKHLPMWDVVRNDPILGRNPLWMELLNARDVEPANTERCPF